MSVPVIDVTPLVARTAGRARVAAEIGAACRDAGFFSIVGHGVDASLQERLLAASRAFFARDGSTKCAIAMERGGRAWRGYFPVGGELTSGVADRKEGLYFGEELDARDPRVVAGVPLHGANLFPASDPALREAVLPYMAAMTALGHALLEGIARSLGLDDEFFIVRYTADPLVLFRIFNYPAAHAEPDAAAWGVGEHTDYGLLTILKQDDVGGLEVRAPSGWVAVPPRPDAFVVNIGDMLDRMTGGAYRSTPHRVRNRSARDRVSFAFFLDPNWNARVEPLPMTSATPGTAGRWDGEDPAAFGGTYGEYVLSKVRKVFPHLDAAVR